MLSEVKTLIEYYKLKPLPVEGTLFCSTYRPIPEGGKPLGSAIIGLYCEQPRSCSLFHKLAVDEIWHFYKGDPLRLILLYPDGSTRDVIMGDDVLSGQFVQFIVPAGVWQAGELLSGGRYSLYGCTMAPGFTEDMFEGGTAANLIEAYPVRNEDISRLSCRQDDLTMPEGAAT